MVKDCTAFSDADGNFRLKRNEFRLSAMVHGKIFIAAVRQQFAAGVKGITHIFWGMGVGSNGYHLASQLPVAHENLPAGIGLAQAVLETACVALQGFTVSIRIFKRGSIHWLRCR